MNISIIKSLAIVGFATVLTSFTTTDVVKNENLISKEASASKTYKIRYGLLTKSGTKVLSGNYDVGSFVATNTTTGETFDTYYGGGFQSLPAYSEGLPEGTYEFYAMQGQGGWLGYGSVTSTVSDAQVDTDGYVTIYIPIAWEE
ncbi:hypothetical protein ABEG63_01800 [Chryseobacterium sp. C39-AII1]|uniref:hypothetical protein n=1 Tax=Chryseobacterium sp. C39-AII1 TaxID=3080332 RepID=UPI0032090F77